MVGNRRDKHFFMYSLIILMLLFFISCGSDGSSSSATDDPANGNSVASWTHPTDLTDGILTAGGFPYYPQVALAKNGDIGLIYVDEDNSGDPHIYLSEYRDGAWTHPATVNDYLSLPGSDVVGFSYNIPQIAMSDNGDTVVTWMQEDITLGGSECYFMSEFRNGSWTHPADLDDHLNLGPGGTFGGPAKIAMSSSGETVIIWSQNIPSGPMRTFISEYRNDSWAHPADTTAYISAVVSACYDPQASMNDSGETILTWVQRIAMGSTDYNIAKSEYRNGSWTHQSGTDDYISPDGYGYERKPISAISDNGDAVIVWRQATKNDKFDTDSKVFMSEYRNGSWTHPAGLDDFIGLPGEDTPAQDPEVAMDDNGNTIIVWGQMDAPGSSHLYMSQYENGTWTHPGTDDYISPDGTTGISDYQVALTGKGDAIVVWLQRDGSGDKQLFMSEYRGGVWTHPASTNDFISIAGQEVYDVDLAMDDNGNAIIVWRQYDGTYDRLFMSVYK